MKLELREFQLKHPAAPSSAPLGLFYCFDAQFMHPSLISLCSALTQLSQAIPVYLFTSQISDALVQAVGQLQARFQAPIRLFEIEAQHLERFHANAHLSRAAFLRILVPDLMPEPYLVYLDGDTLVRHDLLELLDFCGEALLGAVVDTHAQREGQAQSLGLAPDEPYLNTGVLLINRRRWTQEQVSARLIEAYEAMPDASERLPWLDQDLINLVLQGEKLVLPEDWNLLQRDYGYWGLQEQWQGRRGIFHFASHIKPWMQCCDLWAQELWRQAGFHCPLGPMEVLEPRNPDEQYFYSRALYHAGRYKEAYQVLRKVLLSPLKGAH